MITKTRFNTLIKLIRHKFSTWCHHRFNGIVKAQLKDPKQIPIIIISFNQLYFLQKLIGFLQTNCYSNIVIVDNKSTYKPLLDYFEMIKTQVTIYRLEENIGHLSFWKSEVIYKKYSKGYYVVTDADIVPVENCPVDFMDTFRTLLDKAYDRTKVGFSLALDDLPDTNPHKEKIINWENPYWQTEISPNVFKAPIDTTFALYRPGYNYQLKDFTKAWRTAAPIQAQHGGWYIDPKALTEEQAYYMKTANASASWQINAEGDLINTTHQPLYANED